MYKERITRVNFRIILLLLSMSLKDTRVYTLRLIGRNSHPVTAFGVALLLSLAAGLSEELLFRGGLQMWIRAWAGPQVAIMLSAATFGLAHFPVFGASKHACSLPLSQHVSSPRISPSCLDALSHSLHLAPSRSISLNFSGCSADAGALVEAGECQHT